MEKVEAVKPYGQDGEKTPQVRRMFDSIAPAYDFMNRAMTWGLDLWWRRVACRLVGRMRPQRILDVATGTGDFAVQLCRHVHPQSLTGVDLSQGMLDVAREKVARRGLQGTIALQQADVLQLPFDEGQFDAVTVAFGVRNFEHIEQAYRQMHRVLRPGGLLCVVELSTPQNRLVRWFYDLYTLHLIPWAGSLKSGDSSAYRYLPLSIAAVPQGSDMLDLMRQAGFHDCAVRRLTLGVCSIYTAVR